MPAFTFLGNDDSQRNNNGDDNGDSSSDYNAYEQWTFPNGLLREWLLRCLDRGI